MHEDDHGDIDLIISDGHNKDNNGVANHNKLM